MRKGIIMVIVIGVMFVVFTLVLAALFIMTNQTRIAEHKIKRARAMGAARAGMILAHSMLRTGDWIPSPLTGEEQEYNGTGGDTHCINGDINNRDCPGGNTWNDALIPYNVEIKIWPDGSGDQPINGTSQIDILVEY